MRTLVVCGGAATAAVREHAARGATLVALTEAAETALGAAGLAFRTPAGTLGNGAADAIDEAAIVWTRRFGRTPLLAGRSLRELLEWKGVSLWWFAELYLHHSTGATRRVRLIETFHRLLEALGPDEVEAFGLEPEDAILLSRVCTARRILFHGPARRPAPGTWKTARVALASRWNLLKCLASVAKARLAGGAPVTPAPEARRIVLFLSHAAFWGEPGPAGGGAESREHYFGRLIPEVDASPDLRSYVVAVGPRAAFRKRGARERLDDWLRAPHATGAYVHVHRFLSWRVFREVARAAAEARAAWRSLRRSPALHAAFAHRDVSFADLSGADLGAMLLLQLPWAVRCYEEMRAVLERVPAAVVALYAESSGWGRAAVAACRAAGVPTVGIQHGILYPKYYSYRHEPDEDDCPRPDHTAVFGDAARRFLIAAGNYDPGSLTVTGSPKFDALLETSRAWNRDAVRRELGLDPATRLVVVASRFRGIRETHQSIGSAFPGLLRAVESLPAVQLLVKPHPAEPAAAYAACIAETRAAHARVLSASADLVELLFAADVLVTVESLSAVEALVLDRPVIVLNMPTNLAEMVEAGAALGVAAGEDPRVALGAALDDPATRERLAAARRLYLGDVARGVDGQATARVLDLFRRTAASGRTPATEA